jgi:hypothetical protein
LITLKNKLRWTGFLPLLLLAANAVAAEREHVPNAAAPEERVRKQRAE